MIYDTGERIRALRKRTGWTQRQLAERLGVTDVTVANWEHGRTLPGLEVLRQLLELDASAKGEA